MPEKNEECLNESPERREVLFLGKELLERIRIAWKGYGVPRKNKKCLERIRSDLN